MAKKTIDDIDVAGKRVLVRVDFNVPLDGDRNIIDDTRIKAALPTLWHLLERGASLVLMSHLGRPQGQVTSGLSLAPVAELLHNLLGTSVHFAPDCVGDQVERMAADLKAGQVLLLENVRFHQEEVANDPEFAARLASLGDLFVNDAFGTVHRAHASTEGITHHLPLAVSGYLMKKELQYLDEAVSNPKRPLVAILGGAKVSDKIELVTSLMKTVDALLIGGGMAYTFLKSMGCEIGNSLLDEDSLGVAAEILSCAEANPDLDIVLPVDIIVAEKIAPKAVTQAVGREAIPIDSAGGDIGLETRRQFIERIESAGTVIWNGPLGVFEMEPFAEGTLSVARALEQATWESGVVSIVGGGDTAAAVAQAGVAAKMTHVSTGGGASLECLSGRELPGVTALTDA